MLLSFVIRDTESRLYCETAQSLCDKLGGRMLANGEAVKRSPFYLVYEQLLLVSTISKYICLFACSVGRSRRHIAG